MHEIKQVKISILLMIIALLPPKLCFLLKIIAVHSHNSTFITIFALTT